MITVDEPRLRDCSVRLNWGPCIVLVMVDMPSITIRIPCSLEQWYTEIDCWVAFQVGISGRGGWSWPWAPYFGPFHPNCSQCPGRERITLLPRPTALDVFQRRGLAAGLLPVTRERRTRSSEAGFDRVVARCEMAGRRRIGIQ